MSFNEISDRFRIILELFKRTSYMLRHYLELYELEIVLNLSNVRTISYSFDIFKFSSSSEAMTFL